jgi:signal transduction histidine kinase
MARFTEALSLAEEIGSAQLMASALNNIGLTNGRTGNHSKAMEAAERAMILAKEAELLTAQRDAADVIQESAAALGQFSMAYAMHVLYTQLRDSIVSEENQREVMRHQFQYDFDKKEAVLKAEQEARDAIAAEKLRQRELQRNGLILFVLLALIAAMVLYLSYRAKKRLAAQLEQANQKLTVSEAELKEANAAKDRIFAILSHDLRSPIAQLSSLVDLFRFDPDMDRTALDRMLGQAQVSLGHVLGMAENLLQWARLQMDRISARPEQVDLEVLVAEVQAQLGALAQKKEVSFRTDLAARHVCSDRAILSIALRNVMANAVRFSPQGGQVRISAEIAGADLCIRVFDSGPGFAEPTNGGSGLSAKGGEGAGIGLHVSRQLIALLNGRIENSRQGSETVVSIIIPLAAA